MGEQERLNRKIWEWCYVAEALSERGMLLPGRRGLGFAVGQEPLVALFASAGHYQEQACAEPTSSNESKPRNLTSAYCPQRPDR